MAPFHGFKAIVDPSPVGHSCFCHYDLQHTATVYNCSSTNLNTLPLSVQNCTNWVLLANNKFPNLLESTEYLNEIELLNLENNKIDIVSSSFVTTLSRSQKMKYLNLAGNKLTSLPKEVQRLTNFEKIWLGGNLYHCDCGMTWMIGWMNNFTAPSGKHVIRDYQSLKCHSGLKIGHQIYLLNKVEMGCFPSK